MSYLQSIYENYIKWYFVNIRWQDFIEIIIFAVLFYYVILWIKRSRAWVLLKGAAVIFIFYLIAYLLRLDNALLVFNSAAPYLVTCLVIIFQAEIRRALEQIGGNRLFDFLSVSGNQDGSMLTPEMAEAIIRASYDLGKSRTGALIVLERRITLDDYIATGIALDAQISSSLIMQIFEHNTPLHDGAVIIRNGRIAAATCYLPLSGNKTISKELGTRHRAGLGISEVSDSITVIVSEETGFVSMASGGQLFHALDSDALRQHLSVLFAQPQENWWKRLWKGLRRHEKKD